jgi:hypothetical protein
MKIKSLMNKIDTVNIYEKDYDTLLNLMNNADLRLFTKVVEEFVNGKISLSLFEKVFSNDSYSSIISKNMEVQQKMNEEISRLVQYRRDILGEQYSLDPRITMIGVPIQSISVSDNIESFYETLRSENSFDLIHQLFATVESDDDLTRAIKSKMYSEISGASNLLLYSGEFIVPIDFRYQVLTKSDEAFMRENNLNEDQMKKIKALSAYLRRGVFIQ